MKHSTEIVIDVCDLEDEICATYGIDHFEGRNLFWEEDYCNDSYKSLYLDDDEEYKGYSWQNEEEIKLRNLIYAHLRKCFPNAKRVLVEVTW